MFPDYDRLFQLNRDALTADGYESAYLGVCRRAGMRAVAAYSWDQCVELIAVRDEVPYAQAEQFLALYVTTFPPDENAPVFLELERYDL